MKLHSILKLSLTIIIMSSNISVAANNVYFLPEVKSVGVASDDEQALMYLGMDRNGDLKGICFALEKQADSIIPVADIDATVDNKHFVLFGLRPENTDESKELVCSLGSETNDYIVALFKSSHSNVVFNFNGETRRYSFDTVAFRKYFSGDTMTEQQVIDNYKNGIRAPVLQANKNKLKPQSTQNLAIDKSDEETHQLSELKINNTWKSLNPETRKRLLTAQREWIKHKEAVCKTDVTCLTKMTDERTLLLEAQR